MNDDERKNAMREALEADWERAAMPHPRDILKRVYEENRPRDVALEKWGPIFEEMIENDLRSERRKRFAASRLHDAFPEQNAPDKDELDLDMD